MRKPPTVQCFPVRGGGQGAESTTLLWKGGPGGGSRTHTGSAPRQILLCSPARCVHRCALMCTITALLCCRAFSRTVRYDARERTKYARRFNRKCSSFHGRTSKAVRNELYTARLRRGSLRPRFSAARFSAVSHTHR